MADEVLVASAALEVICRASHDSLASCGHELGQANLAIAHALLLLRSNFQAGHHDIGSVEDELDSIAAEMTNSITSPNTSAQTQSSNTETQNALEKYKAWVCGPENIIAQFAQNWVSSRLMGSERKNGGNDLRRAVIANSPALFLLLKRIVVKRRRPSTRM
tara:strand:+ start:674 stop:1156 length:483 start_codon:yes stop_codon:yes gene_type:complete